MTANCAVTGWPRLSPRSAITIVTRGHAPSAWTVATVPPNSAGSVSWSGRVGGVGQVTPSSRRQQARSLNTARAETGATKVGRFRLVVQEVVAVTVNV